MDYYTTITMSFLREYNNIKTFFGHATGLAGSQFPDQRLNPDHGSESLEF